ncbi:ABC transporter B family member 4, putative [Plasmodium relictum]|uniref:ABC transporter B family member 4, putative n=1 Tax=Plasmodium relictum TaxID=85471 RepID=A0A1J1H8I5_PLARL|nr:ABC transporter B family member 4, putative [Plasmodium relictum]CRG99901.1 ABC transporter B family member 4, putative [Plasmodium relictum]
MKFLCNLAFFFFLACYLTKNIFSKNKQIFKDNEKRNIFFIKFYEWNKKKRNIKFHFRNFIKQKKVLQGKKNYKFIFNKINYKSKKKKEFLRIIKLNVAKKNNDYLFLLNNSKHNEKSNGNLLSSLFYKALEKSKSKSSLLNDATKLFRIIRESKYIFATGFLLTIISSVVDSYIPIFLSKTLAFVMNKSFVILKKSNFQIFNSFINYLNFNNPFYIYVLVSLLSLLFSSFRSYIFNVCAYVSTCKLQNYLFNVLLNKNINFYKKKGKGELISRLNIDSSELIDIFTTNLIVLLRNMIKIVLSFYFLYKINVNLFIMSLFIVIIISNISIFFSSIFRKFAKEESYIIAQSNNIIEESINSFSLIHTFNTHNKEIEKFNKSLDSIYFCRIKLGLLYMLEKFCIRLIDMITFIVTLILSKKTLENNKFVESRTIISSVIYMQNIISQSCIIEQQYSRVQELIGNAEDVIKLIERETIRNNQNKMSSSKYNIYNFFNLIDLKNFILKYSLLKKFQMIQRNSDYVANIMKPNYLKLFERNYNNLMKLLLDNKSYLNDDEFCLLNESKEVKNDENENIIKEEQINIQEKGILNPIQNNINDIKKCKLINLPIDEKNVKLEERDNSIKLNKEIKFNNTMKSFSSKSNIGDIFNKYEQPPNKLKINEYDINIEEIYNFIKNDDELIIKYNLDRKFINFLLSKYKRNILLLILKLYEEKNNLIREKFIFMFDNICSFKKLSIQDKKSILKMSNITNKTLYVILITFLFYNYSKFYYKKKKKNIINFLEKKYKFSSNSLNENLNINSNNEISDVNIDNINMNDALNDATINDTNMNGFQGKNDNSENSYVNNIYKPAKHTEYTNDLYKNNKLSSLNKYECNIEKGNLQLSKPKCINYKEILKKKKKKNFNNIFPCIIQNAIKELEILKFIDENYKYINENLMMDNMKDEKKGSTLIFENVDFYFAKYPKNKILSNINLNFSQKYTYGILCYNDSGKEYLSKLCSRLYNIKYGNILLDNENIKNVSKYILTKKISVIEEESYLFSDTIIYNILYSYNCVTKENKILSHLNYNFKLNQDNINKCIHLFLDHDFLNEDNKKKNVSKSNQEYFHNNGIVEENKDFNFKRCLMCGKKINIRLIQEQKKKKSYNKYKVHFIKKLYKEIMKVCKIVLLKDVINSYSDKFFHKINDKILSGGQKQKISLARAIIKKPQILILDEAFSALDSYNELKIFSNIKKYLPNCTIINISHKTTTINNCDYIYILKDGKIIEEGLRKKLMKNRNSEYVKKINEL